jgi:hypothetical protein
MRKEVRRRLRLVTFKGSNIDPISDLGKLGFSPTSGFRTQKHQDELRAQGLTTTKTGSHPIGDALDFFPPKGMSTQSAIAAVKQKYPGAKAIPSNKGTIHITFPGWGKAPDVSESRERYGD